MLLGDCPAFLTAAEALHSLGIRLGESRHQLRLSLTCSAVMARIDSVIFEPRL
jgi:hypothetical protein